MMTNSLDYTHFPENNLHPGKVNYEKLAGLYGIVGEGRRQLRSSSTSSSTSSTKTEMTTTRDNYSQEWLANYDAAVKELDNIKGGNQNSSNRRGWRRLHEHDQGGVYARLIDKDSILVAHMLFNAD